MGEVRINLIFRRFDGAIARGGKAAVNLSSMPSDRAGCGWLQSGSWFLHWEGVGDPRFFRDLIGSTVGEFWGLSSAVKAGKYNVCIAKASEVSPLLRYIVWDKGFNDRHLESILDLRPPRKGSGLGPTEDEG